jgi:hypothetical protein
MNTNQMSNIVSDLLALADAFAQTRCQADLRLGGDRMFNLTYGLALTSHRQEKWGSFFRRSAKLIYWGTKKVRVQSDGTWIAALPTQEL